MNRIGVFSFARKQSERCPNKALRPFGNTTLTDIVLSKLAGCGHFSFFAGYEDEFRVKCERHGVRFVRRDKRSIMIDQPIGEILAFLEDVDCEYLLLLSACLPFLELSTITTFLADCIEHECQSAFSVTIRRKHFLRRDRTGINFDINAKTLNTKAVEPIYELVDALYFFNRRFFLEHGTYWDWKRVRLIELNDKYQLFDIDTEEDFALAEALWGAVDGRVRRDRDQGL